MSEELKTPVEKISIPEGYSLMLTPNISTEIICDVCGAKNDASRTLCRVCSNYLEEEKEDE